MDLLRSVYTKLEGRSLREILQKGPPYVQRQVFRRPRRVYYRKKLHKNTARIADRRRAAVGRLTDNSVILFLCHGNICRSPFAERYARQQLAARGITGITVESSGLKGQPDLQSPPNARTAANSRGVSLDDNCSLQADTQLIERADLILVMDYRNYHSFTTKFPNAADRMFMLGIFDDREEIAISDPYGDAPEAYETAYGRIISSIDRLLAAAEVQRRNDRGARANGDN